MVLSPVRYLDVLKQDMVQNKLEKLIKGVSKNDIKKIYRGTNFL